MRTGEGYVRSIAIRSSWQQPGRQNLPRPFFRFIGQLQYRKPLQGFESSLSHCSFADRDFVYYNLGREKLVIEPLNFPPISGDLLPCRLQQVPCGTGDYVAWDGALNVN